MQKNPILVRNIRHLTDARYFAAMEVDWITMELSEDPLTFSRWHMLREWIEGVKLAAEPRSDDESLLAKIIINAMPDGLLTDQLDFIHLTGGLQLFYLNDQLPQKNENHSFTQIISYDPDSIPIDLLLQLPPNKFFLQANWTPGSLSTLLEREYKGGICLMGEDETITGVKDYLVVDQLIELLRT